MVSRFAGYPFIAEAEWCLQNGSIQLALPRHKHWVVEYNSRGR